MLRISTCGWIEDVRRCVSPNFDEREHHSEPQAIILHCISLPPGQYGGDHVPRFFSNALEPSEHEYFESIAHLTVSAHFFVRRDGELIQHVSCNKRAWHAGESFCLDKPKVNDFSVGIELEGLDTDPGGFTEAQYQCLSKLVAALKVRYSDIKATNVFAHSDIAPGRKPDPGPFFDWSRIYPQVLDNA